MIPIQTTIIHFSFIALRPSCARPAVQTLRRFVLCLVLLLGAVPARVMAEDVENSPEVAGFRGEVSGVVKSAQADGSEFVLAVVSATIDPDGSKLKDPAPLIGKELSIGVRMPKTDGQAHQHPDDLAYVKTLKPGDTIAVKIFSLFKNPRVLRIQAPGKPAENSNGAGRN